MSAGREKWTNRIPTKQVGQLGHRVGSVMIWGMTPVFRDLHSNTSLNTLLCFGLLLFLLTAVGHPSGGQQAAFATHNSARVEPLRDETRMSHASIQFYMSMRHTR